MRTNTSGFMLENGYVVEMAGVGKWRLKGAEREFALDDLSDFSRIISLLEEPVYDVRLILGSKFPLANVAAAGLISDSDYWVALALEWIGDFTREES